MAAGEAGKKRSHTLSSTYTYGACLDAANFSFEDLTTIESSERKLKEKHALAMKVSSR